MMVVILSRDKREYVLQLYSINVVMSLFDFNVASSRYVS